MHIYAYINIVRWFDGYIGYKRYGVRSRVTVAQLDARVKNVNSASEIWARID